MPPLAPEGRKQLENVCVQARDLAEAAARAALKRWAVDAAEPFEHFSAWDKAFRKRLRARGRQAGDRRDEKKGSQEIDRLTEELAYEYWHRMLFARFLAENNLLMHPDGVSVTLADCEELAPSEKAANGFVLAARYASRMLPQIFRTDDVLLEVEFPINDRLPLEKKLAELPSPVFTADDSLGWVYQFWQTKKKKEVNASGKPIDGRSLPAVTQLFTEHYMVEFLLHNTIGAWWCARNGVSGPPGGAAVRDRKCPVQLDYLRWKDDGTPAAGAFEGWPKSLKEFTMLDPCCGSGHFLVAAFHLLVPLRMHDEGLSPRDAVDAVLRENLFGLELDPRCTQIAAFALAMAAWKHPSEDGEPLGYRPLPPLNIACSGQGVVGTKDDWTRFANSDARFREGMERLYDLFEKAPALGSLIDPCTVGDDLFALGFDTLKGTLDRTLKKLEAQADPDRAAVGVAAQGIAVAASLMTREFTLVATNVPYLGRGLHDSVLADYGDRVEMDARSDLATLFLARSLKWLAQGCTLAVVTPQNWWFLHSYLNFRKRLLQRVRLQLAVSLGEEAWHAFGNRGPRTILLIMDTGKPQETHSFLGIDVSSNHQGPAFPIEKKIATLRGSVTEIEGTGRRRFIWVGQKHQLDNPDSRIIIGEPRIGSRLSDYAEAGEGCSTGDNDRFVMCFWEVGSGSDVWSSYPGADGLSRPWGGREYVVRWEKGKGELARSSQARIRSKPFWTRKGLLIGRIRGISATLFDGGLFDKACVVLAPKRKEHLLAIYGFVKSGEYEQLIREIDQKVATSTGAMTKVPFDIDYWTERAKDLYPDGLPNRAATDPSQYVFSGRIKGADDPLLVAVARLLGYRWPDQEPDGLDRLADADGIVCIPAVRAEPSAADRLLEVLRAAHGPEWSPGLLEKLLTDSGCKPGTTLDDWLRNAFFEQHCKRFHQRPFVWHIWDGRREGFACLVNYHKLDHVRLESLTYSYLADWISAQAGDAKAGKTGADLRLAAAEELRDKLKLILAGEPPHDIFVRWKPLAEQPIGWNPDLNDGVRLNIRPFVTAGILRKNPNVKWTKDRGAEPQRPRDQFPWFWNGGTFKGERVNDVRLTNADKQTARSRDSTES